VEDEQAEHVAGCDGRVHGVSVWARQPAKAPSHAEPSGRAVHVARAEMALQTPFRDNVDEPASHEGGRDDGGGRPGEADEARGSVEVAKVHVPACVQS